MKVLICVEAGAVAQVVVDDPNVEVILVDRDLLEVSETTYDISPDMDCSDMANVSYEIPVVDPEYINRIEQLMRT